MGKKIKINNKKNIIKRKDGHTIIITPNALERMTNAIFKELEINKKNNLL